MKSRVFNFNAGPSVLPVEVLRKAQDDMMDYHGLGLSIMELSHRSDTFDALMGKVESDLRHLLEIPSNYHVLFLQGGASLQFSMVPMNFLPKDKSADYIINGIWGQKAAIEAQKFGKIRWITDPENEYFRRIPLLTPEDFDPQASFIHFTSNETIQGVQWRQVPLNPYGVPLICDMSSDILSRPLDVSEYGVIYAGAQKNCGPSGVTLVIIREDLLNKIPADLPSMLDYRLQVEKKSLHNTPPSFSIYIVGLVLEWLIDLGGLQEIASINANKARLIYQTIDQSGGFYQGYAEPSSRSLMNVTFKLPSEELDDLFVKEAANRELTFLKGHPSMGGIRVSIYNACPLEAVEALVDFMAFFQRENG